MDIKAIVYFSNTGHTERYAKILGEKTGLPVYDLKTAKAELEQGTRIIFMGWIFMTAIREYVTAAKLFDVAAVCGIGISDNGTLEAEARDGNDIPEETAYFTIQGGMDKTKVKGLYKIILKILIKWVRSTKNMTESDKRMLWLLENDRDYVCEENLTAVMKWFEEYKEK